MLIYMTDSKFAVTNLISPNSILFHPILPLGVQTFLPIIRSQMITFIILTPGGIEKTMLVATFSHIEA
jgi:hypothetical protein